ncbi:hypothetical protein PAAG_12044 [Paracoccidioides lutzii Pb01]|uniref:Uncharacterized protein n=1 Tax=Paracoccidioides lutzii (strain ATCC MYA-826 / Pb01) TaxID=502779 RepID=A0A0A2V1B0_PARBA|nr:hypothetical protein PAAG_12044 [Paracoccidioides lutzii Pb01]KGQ01273.1 hypothetical protein PAAG_12044 [Paracoccidioides lutzii Pb01]
MAGGLFCDTPIQKRGVGGLRLTGLAFYVGAWSSYRPHTDYEPPRGGALVESEEEEGCDAKRTEKVASAGRKHDLLPDPGGYGQSAVKGVTAE